jgi:hypothetical protein
VASGKQWNDELSNAACAPQMNPKHQTSKSIPTMERTKRRDFFNNNKHATLIKLLAEQQTIFIIFLF